jgi:anaerobic selenocysteine-containing dehydrogenase
VQLAVASAHQTLEELVLFRKLATRIAGEENLVGGLVSDGVAEGDGLLLSADRTPNRRSLEWLGLSEIPAADLASRVSAAGKAVVVYGADPAADPEVADALAGGERLVYCGTHANATARAAALVLPTSTWAEKDGLFVHGQGRIQAIRRAVAPPGEAKEDWRLWVELLGAAGEAGAPESLAAVRKLAAAELELPSGTDLDHLPETGLVPELSVPSTAGGER